MKNLSNLIHLIIPCTLSIVMASCDLMPLPSEQDALSERRQLFPKADWGILDSTLTADERSSMEFLYAYMPVSDYADYSGRFFLDNTRAALRTRTATAWGKSVPDSLFRHFVLPVRVNNEELDSFRTKYQDELLHRIEGMTMQEAALEINHWCHEHVSYTPSDARTSSPLSTLRTSRGRCGEESVIAVAAMRTVGIPSRQVYTPRWAHTDDNHAWIEVWTGDRWHFMGACEPEAVLDLAWFNGPASRAMLMHTQVMGAYTMADDIIKQDRCYTEINVISNYVKTRRNTVRIVDSKGEPVSGARVEMKIYNYAEFSTVARLVSDTTGTVHLTTGLGDMLAWASKDGQFGYALMHSDTTIVRLTHRDGDVFADSIDITPPKDGMIETKQTAEQASKNKQRLAAEDALLAKYRATFVSKDSAAAIGFGIAAARLIAASEGNHSEIISFLGTCTGRLATDILETLSQKDLRDAPSATLSAYYFRAKRVPTGLPTDVYRCLIAPRVENEPLRPFSVPTDGSYGLPTAAAAQKNPELVMKWVSDSIGDASDYNPRNLRISPQGVWRLRAADKTSRRIFLVALCRALGVPARINSVTGRAEYYIKQSEKSQWQLKTFADEPTTSADGETQASAKGAFVLQRPAPIAKGELPDLAYYRHLSLTYITRGEGRLLNFESGDATELGAEATWRNTFSRPYAADAGYYLLVSGTRLASGKVLARMQTFNVESGQTARVPLLMRHDSEALSVVASIDAETTYTAIQQNNAKAENKATSILATTGRGYFLLALIGAHDEPSNHATRSLQAIAQKINSWQRPVVVMFQSEGEQAAFDPQRLSALKHACYGIDLQSASRHGGVMQMMSEALPIGHAPRLPLIVIADTFGRVVYYSEGYNTALETQLTAAIDQL